VGQSIYHNGKEYGYLVSIEKVVLQDVKLDSL